jgi:hypothetical protein
MNEQKTVHDDAAAATENRPDTAESNKTQHTTSPASDPTNPYNQEPAGDWVANERATERSNNEPGLTDHDRKQRRW